MPWDISNYNTNPALNSAINTIDIAEGSAAAGYNNALRQMMADIATWVAANGVTYPISIAHGGTGQTTAAAGLAALGGLDVSFRNLVRVDKTANFTISNAERAYGIVWNSAAVGTATINPNATTAIDNGAVFLLHNYGPGVLNVVRGGGVLLFVNGAAVSADAAIAVHGTATLTNWGVDYWSILGAGVS